MPSHGSVPLGTRRVIDVIPRGLVCPVCGCGRPNPNQWAVSLGEHRAMCRSCLSTRLHLIVPPVRSENDEPLRTSSERYLTVSGGEIKEAKPAGCVFNCGGITRRIEGYCVDCQFKLLREAHGGYGACRVDSRGHEFVVFNDDLFIGNTAYSNTVVPREAFYPWGRELLPRVESRPSTREAFDAQTQRMWKGVEVFIDFAQRVAKQRVGKNYTEEVHDAAMEACGKAFLWFDPSLQNGKFETYLYRCVANAVHRTAARESRRRRRTESLHSPKSEYARDIEDPSAKAALDALFSDVQDPTVLLNKLGLTPFQRKLLRLHYVDGYTLEAIGHRYGVVKTTVHSWIYRIRTQALKAYSALQ